MRAPLVARNTSKQYLTSRHVRCSITSSIVVMALEIIYLRSVPFSTFDENKISFTLLQRKKPVCLNKPGYTELLLEER